ncbi:transcription factor bHLH35-like [Curcuma longa]|uniref:transcription factor bHLH35-like n=1 Tax=Curcuma longa TaxID=136217 RepID=UPI003D9F6EB2
MDDMNAEYNFYWETRRFMDFEEQDSWGLDEAVSGGYYGSSSPEGASSPPPPSTEPPPATAPPAAKTIAMERNRRKKLDDKLYALRSIVPKITKMNKASIIKDAIDYIVQLQEEERQMEAEISELESKLKQELTSADDVAQHENLRLMQRKKKRTASALVLPNSPPIQVVELKVTEVGEKTMVISITCNKKRDTMIKLCDLFESFNIKVITANITCVAGSLLHTLFIQSDEMGSAQLKDEIETAIIRLDGPRSTSSSSY